MRLNRTMMALLAVGGLAFAAGRLGALPGAAAVAETPQDQDLETTPEMEAMVRAGTPGKHHRVIDQLSGNWEGVFRMRSSEAEPWMETPGTITREWILDGRYMRETVRAESEWGTFEGLGYVGFNNLDGMFEVVWMDSMSTAINFAQGTYDPDAKTMKFTGTMRDPLTGRLIPTRGHLDMSSPDRHVYKDYAVGADGREFLAFDGVVERSN